MEQEFYVDNIEDVNKNARSLTDVSFKPSFSVH